MRVKPITDLLRRREAIPKQRVILPVAFYEFDPDDSEKPEDETLRDFCDCGCFVSGRL